MKLILSCFIVLFFLIINVEAQESWIAQVSGTTNSLSSVYFVNSTTGWVVGAKGTILKTNNGGTTWTAQSNGVTTTLNSVFFASPTTGWAVGASGTYLKTSNGGSTWTDSSFGVVYTFNSTYFIDANIGWIAGNYLNNSNGELTAVVGGTTNAGSIWNLNPLFSSQNTMVLVTSVYFTNANMGWAVMANGYVFKTINGGVQWMRQYPPSNSLSSVQFVDTNTGWAVGTNGIIIKTTNGGANWTAQQLTTRNLHSVSFPNSNIGWVTGDTGIIGKTMDGGLTWAIQSSGTMNTLNSVHFVNDSTGWAVGNSGIILKHTGIPVPVFSATSHSQNLFQSHFGHISYQLFYPSRVSATVFNLQGQTVLKLFKGVQSSGYHELSIPFGQWQGNDFLRFQTDQFQKTLQLGR